uniref:peptidoglycan-binding domain-containing protein n=1 Tax=Pararhizobium sp. IMCC3301 TaxID=3067904 RepID=UPI002741DCE9|nr:peptidoglycan-binding domain-containing protein [Pararhizobium sp. IMCC3301]
MKSFMTVPAGVAYPSVSYANTLNVDDINAAEPIDEMSLAATIKLQVLLDYAVASPSVVDGQDGPNTTSAIMAYERINGLGQDGKVKLTK